LRVQRAAELGVNPMIITDVRYVAKGAFFKLEIDFNCLPNGAEVGVGVWWLGKDKAGHSCFGWKDRSRSLFNGLSRKPIAQATPQ
jgi:hypothetical protein